MKSGKRVLGVIIISLLLIISISLVSAGIKDWFGFGDKSELEGELPETAVARLKIEDTSVPNITYVSNVSSNSGADIAPDLIKLKSKTGNGETLLSFWFVAQQGGGGGPGDLSNLAGTTSRAFLTRNLELTRSNISCSPISEIGCGGGLYCAGTGTGINFSCTVPMKYYDGNGTWNINVSVKASTTNYGYNTTETFGIGATFAAYAHTNYLNWTNPVLTTSTTNRFSDNNITIENNGNVPFSGVKVNATILNGTDAGYQYQYIPTDRFNAYSCVTNPGVILVRDELVGVGTFIAARATDDGGKNSSLPFCVTSLSGTPTALKSQLYNSSRAWVLDLS